MNRPGKRKVLDRWLAFNAVEPIAMPWQETATIAAEVYSLNQMIAASHGIQLPSRPLKDWIPTVDQSSQVAPESKVMTADQDMAWARRMAGIR